MLAHLLVAALLFCTKSGKPVVLRDMHSSLSVHVAGKGCRSESLPEFIVCRFSSQGISESYRESKRLVTAEFIGTMMRTFVDSHKAAAHPDIEQPALHQLACYINDRLPPLEDLLA